MDAEEFALQKYYHGIKKLNVGVIEEPAFESEATDEPFEHDFEVVDVRQAKLEKKALRKKHKLCRIKFDNTFSANRRQNVKECQEARSKKLRMLTDLDF